MFYLYHGKDTYRSLQAIKEKIAAIQKKDPTFTKIVINAPELDAAEISSIYSSINMFSPNTILLIKRLSEHSQKKSLLNDLINFQNNNNDSNSLITLLWENKTIRSNTIYYKSIKQNATIKVFKELNERQFYNWAKQQCQPNQLKLNVNSIKFLANRTNFIPERFVTALQKLRNVDSNDKDGKIDIEQIKNYTSDTFESVIWNLIDALNDPSHNQKTRSTSLSILNNLFRQNTEPAYLIAMIARNLRQLVLVKYLSDPEKYGHSIQLDMIAKVAHIPYFTLGKLEKKAESIEMNRLLGLYDKLSNLDYKIKNEIIDPHIGITLLFLAL